MTLSKSHLAFVYCLQWKLWKRPHVACTAQAADAFQSMKVGNYINEFWWLIRKCHYLSHYIMNHCIHMVFENYISNVINAYIDTLNVYYRKNGEIRPQNYVNFWRRSNLWLFTVSFLWQHSITQKWHASYSSISGKSKKWSPHFDLEVVKYNLTFKITV